MIWWIVLALALVGTVASVVLSDSVPLFLINLAVALFAASMLPRRRR